MINQETMSGIVNQMFVFIVEQAPIFIIVIASTLLVLSILWFLSKLGLIETVEEQDSNTSENMSCCQHELAFRQDLLDKMDKGIKSIEEIGSAIEMTRETVITFVSTRG